ncbi:putative 2OG-Fe(II) oxygenase [Altererythrobacter sp. TH136]|uniref:putative 2OG-Fe(II) oxygenase n=1 Tax=Altererythrobacter sp. TH136 TaxID=2067415 RepID=UPI001FEEAF42|nr:putative 2OG-Fe(II) oxygenase [Altererythrobacter sp. TH136]
MADEARRQAGAAAAAGDPLQAFRLLEAAARQRGSDAPLWNSAGNAAMRAGQVEDAAAAFGRAVDADPASLEYAINHAIALGRCGRDQAAIDALVHHAAAGARDARYCSVRAARALALGQRAEAARWYDAALAAEPGHARATLGRARVALERAEPDAVEQFERAIAAQPGDRERWLGKAQALEADARFAEAAEVAAALTAQMPGWIDALRFETALLLKAGDPDCTRPFAAAEAALPGDPAIAAAHVEALGALDRFGAAADRAAAARTRFPAIPEFAMLEAQHAGAAGDDARAELIWRELPLRSTERDLLEARHRLRVGQPDAAVRLLNRVREADHANVTAWALLGVAWRLLDDPRAGWLHEQPGLVAMLPLHGWTELREEVTALLHQLHDAAAPPLGQSLRGGTQTRGGLFDRMEQPFVRLADTIDATLEDYRAQLPAADAAHPLLRHRDAPWRIAGSWSVRLAGGGDHHTAHIHPFGILSSALYAEIPPPALDQDPEAGWLEVGRPAADLRLDLPPLHVIRPVPGDLALFPSTLFHGTRPFSGGRRMTVAFDVHTGGATA